jgi:multidrug efflux pump
VFGGMIMATFVAPIFIPMFFSWLSRKQSRASAAVSQDAIKDPA